MFTPLVLRCVYLYRKAVGQVKRRSARRRATKRRRDWRRWARIGATVALALGTIGLIILVIWPPINDVATGQTPQYPEIQPQVLRYSPDLVLERAAETIESLPRWRVVEVDREERRVTAERTSRLFNFVDDVTVWVEPSGAGSIVNVRSHSRVGRGDLGQNARNIILFQRSLEENLRLARQES